MKTAYKPTKNICKTEPFFGVLHYIRICVVKTPYLSGLPPSGPERIRPEIAVSMDEFPQLNGVPQ